MSKDKFLPCNYSLRINNFFLAENFYYKAEIEKKITKENT